MKEDKKKKHDFWKEEEKKEKNDIVYKNIELTISLSFCCFWCGRRWCTTHWKR